MPTFCRHNRFIERCPICSKTLPDYAQPPHGSGGAAGRSGGSDRGSGGGASATRGQGKRSGSASGVRRSAARRLRAGDVRVYGDGRKREVDDGYRCELLPGLRSSEDARLLLEEISFASARLQALTLSPPGPYATAAKLGEEDIEGASLLCFLIAYLCPLNGDEPFTAISKAPSPEQDSDAQDEQIETLALGPRTCHQQGRGAATLHAYLAWAQRAGSQRQGLIGELSWSPERRFERIFERLAIPGFPRWGRYELLVLLGRLGLYELLADSLHLPSALAGDPVLVAAKRAFAIGDPILLERRARGLTEEIAVPLEALELALFNWFSPQRATLGFPAELRDAGTIERGEHALGL